MDALVPLDLEVALMRLLELMRGHAEEAGMHVHERRHENLSWDLAIAGTSRLVPAPTDAIGESTHGASADTPIRRLAGVRGGVCEPRWASSVT
jgi:hypothetical protein